MKIALLGASDSGKTVYFSGLSYKFRNSVAFSKLSAEEKNRYKKINAERRVGFRISVSRSSLEKDLSKNMNLLGAKPIDPWPEPTNALDESNIECQFRFASVDEESSADIEVHHRTIELYDPTGGALVGHAERSDAIVSKLCTCDVAIAFFPANIIANCAEDDDIDGLQNKLLLGKIIDIVMKARERMSGDDILPLCFVISKSDELTNRHQNFINKVNEILYDRLIIPFSRENPNIMLCVCPTSVLDPLTKSFRASNLEWPFLFAAGGTIFRNSLAFRDNAADAARLASDASRLAEETRQKGWWTRFKLFMNGEGVGAHNRRAREHLDRYGRLIRQAEDDHELAVNAWTSLAIEGKSCGVRVYMEGKEIDPRTKVG